MITIEDIKVNIRDFRDKLVRRTLTMGMIVKALDNIEKNFEEYAHLSNKFYNEQIECREKEMKLMELDYLTNKKVTTNQLLIDALEEQDKEVQRLTDIIIGYKQGDENKVKEWTQVDDEGRPHD